LRTRETGTEEERLLIEAAQRDPGRFAELYRDNFHTVYAFVARKVRRRERVEDLTADVFQQALAALPRFEWRGVPFAGWLLRIAANAIADHYRQAAREDDTARVEPAEEPEMEEAVQRGQLFRLVDGPRSAPRDRHALCGTETDTGDREGARADQGP
jgi:RNA polymerase sigma-70 factor, ECF subfamily